MDTLRRFAAKELATARETLYTVPAGSTAVIRHVSFVNTTGSQITVQLWLGGLTVEPSLAVPASTSRAQDAVWVLPATEAIEAVASAAGLNCFIYGVEES